MISPHISVSVRPGDKIKVERYHSERVSIEFGDVMEPSLTVFIPEERILPLARDLIAKSLPAKMLKPSEGDNSAVTAGLLLAASRTDDPEIRAILLDLYMSCKGLN